jgi:hypothetical protein
MQDSPWHWAVCDVCRLVDGDSSPKVCFYCSSCDSEICIDDADRFGRRALAAMRRRLEVFRYGLSA